MNKHLLYYNDSYLKNVKTHILEVGRDEKGLYIIPEQTNFHPQGGGQPSDEGTLTISGKTLPVTNLYVQKNALIRHYIPEIDLSVNVSKGQPISLSINMEKRLLFAAYHTAGHLIANLLEIGYPDLFIYKGNHFPGQAAVFAKSKESSIPQKEDFQNYDYQEISDYLTEEIKKSIQNKIPLKITPGENRIIQIGDMKKYSCGGTHVNNLVELKKIVISKIKFKKKEGLKISYEVQL